MHSRWGVALWFAGCGAVAWTGAAVAYMFMPLLSLVVLGVAGVVAGLRLSTFASIHVGMAVTAVIGSIGSSLPVVATQAMSQGVSAGDFTMRAIGAFVVAHVIGAGLGFIGVLRRSGRAYVGLVAGFALGGAAGGVLLGLSWASSIFAIGALAIVAPWAVGGALAERTLRQAQLPDEARPWATTRWSMAGVIILAVLLGATAYWSMQRARERAEAMRPLVAKDGAIMGERAALYNGLAQLTERTDLSAGERAALEIYIAVRYRDWLATDAALAVPQWQPLADDIERRHADKTLDDLLAASQQLGADYLDQLNRPYIPKAP